MLHRRTRILRFMPPSADIENRLSDGRAVAQLEGLDDDGAAGEAPRAPAAPPPQRPQPPRGAHKPQRQTQHRPNGHAAPAEPKRATAGDQPRRRPAAEDAARKDRGWRDGDFRDGSPAPAFLRRGR